MGKTASSLNGFGLSFVPAIVDAKWVASSLENSYLVFIADKTFY